MKLSKAQEEVLRKLLTGDILSITGKKANMRTINCLRGAGLITSSYLNWRWILTDKGRETAEGLK